MPVCVFQAAMVSADGVTIALAFLAIALAMQLAQAEPGVSPRRAIVEVGLLAVALGLAKPPYIVFLLLFVPAVVRHRHEIMGRLLPAAMIPGVALFAWWSHYAQSVWLPPINPFNPGNLPIGLRPGDADQSRQLAFVEHHPLHFLAATSTTLARTWRVLLQNVVAQVAGWRPPGPLGVVPAVLTWAALLLAVALAASSGAGRDEPRSAWVVEIVTDTVVAGGTFVALFLFAYTGWNTVGADRVDAFQGRYLVPVLALVSMAIAPQVGRSLTSRVRMSGRGTVLWSAAPWLLIVVAQAFMAIGLIGHCY